MSKKIAVVLSGCGVFDGSEINEVVVTLLELEKAGASFECFAPDRPMRHTLNHIAGEEITESRNVLVESSRITRGQVRPITELNVSEFDALVVPGGFGVAKNLSDFAVKGADYTIEPDFKAVMEAFKDAGKAAGYMCIAPVLLPSVYPQIACTIGNDQDTASVVTAHGGEHVECPVDDIVFDEKYKVVSTPAYMLAQSIAPAAAGIEKFVKKIVEIA